MDSLKNIEVFRDRTVVVTGAHGFIGHHVVEFGRRHGVKVVATSSVKDGSGDFTYLDILDSKAAKSLIKEVQPSGVIHLAAVGVVGRTSVSESLLVNAVGTARLLEALSEIDTKIPVVVAGSGFEYESREKPIREVDPVAPGTAYGVSKAASTLAASLFAGNMPISVLRLFSVYGDGERSVRLGPSIIESAQLGKPIELTGCEQIRDFTYVGDVAESFWRVLSAPLEGFRVLNVGSGQAITLRNFVEALSAILIEHGLTPSLVFGAKPYRSGEPMHYVADISLLRDLLGWAPSTVIEEGLRRMVEASGV